MNIVLYTHPEFLGLKSQERFAAMLCRAYRERGHRVDLRRPAAYVRRWLPRPPLAKWAGYVDQYLLFPQCLRAALRNDPADTLHVLCDQALGPWLPLLAGRPHVVHCHDLLALRSALGEFPAQPTGWSGRLYQRWIRRGFAQARHFISISQHSRAELQRLGGVAPLTSEVVHNGLNHPYAPLPAAAVQQRLRDAGLAADDAGCLLHVGSGQWYKNAPGVLMLYGRYVDGMQALGRAPLPLVMVSPAPGPALQALLAGLPKQAEVRFCSGVGADTLQALYSHARALLFPSLAEGFGWPIAEALACGCPVLTTGAAPMTEVGGPHAHYLRPLRSGDDAAAWARDGAALLIDVLDRPPTEQARAAAAGRDWARRFDAGLAIDRYLAIYRRVLEIETAGVAQAVVS